MSLKKNFDALRSQNPLVLNLTNEVVQNWTANVLLALGASPVMSSDKEDALGLCAMASAVNINIGTLNGAFMERARACVHSAAAPIILDPVGAGATPPRTAAALEFLPHAAIVRGNKGEISALQGASGTVKGVDASASGAEPSPSYFAEHFPRLTVSASGAEDFIFDKERSLRLPFGTPLMTKVTGMGCALSAVTAAFAAVEEDPFLASAQASAFYGLCGELALKQSPLPGAFASAFLDALYAPDWDYISSRSEPFKELL